MYKVQVGRGPAYWLPGMSSKKLPPKKPPLNQPSIDTKLENEEKRTESEESTPEKADVQEPIEGAGDDFRGESDRLVQKLHEKTKEIERLSILLETLVPIPGLEPEKIRRVIEGDSSGVDYRDSKIVALAKKCRRLQVALNKERANEISNSTKILELTKLTEQVKKELEDARREASSERKSSSPHGGSSTALESLQQDLVLANKQIEELRRKLSMSTEEVRKLQRVLQREVGDGASVAMTSEEGWRGRAQLIVMLKAKVKRLEAEVISNSENGQGKPHRRRRDVDSRVEQELADMQLERQRVLDGLLLEKTKLAEECARLKDRLDGSRARAQILAEEGMNLKENIKVWKI